MKLYQIIFVVIALLTTACANVVGNGNITEVEHTLTAFDKIDNSCSAQIRYHKSDEYRAVVTTDSNVQEYVKLVKRHNTLDISFTKPGRYQIKTLQIDVYCPTLSEISISGAGFFKAVDTIEAKSFVMDISGSGAMDIDVVSTDCEIDISGSGRVSGQIVCQNFTSDISGSGNIALTGSSDKAKINVSGMGNFQGSDFQTGETYVNISGMGNVVTSGDNVHYRKNSGFKFTFLGYDDDGNEW